MIRPDSLLISGYVHPAMLTALCWAKVNGKCAVLMFDSKADDKPRWALKEWCKSLIVGRFDAALGGGKAHAAYAISLGLPPHRVFSGVDVVDNEFFWRNAQGVRRQEEQTRIRLGLPRPFFLSVCRFIPKKNLFRLIKAYRLYLKIVSSPPWDLVLCGSGPQEPALRQEAANLSGVHFPGFKQSEELPAYYGLADCFILASSEFEQWGLVVNEAMACGLPVLVSKACGCAQDLVQDGLNGYVFDPHNVVELAGLLHKMSSGETDLTSMGKASRRIIAHWTLETFAENMLKAIRVANVD